MRARLLYISCPSKPFGFVVNNQRVFIFLVNFIFVSILFRCCVYSDNSSRLYDQVGNAYYPHYL